MAPRAQVEDLWKRRESTLPFKQDGRKKRYRWIQINQWDWWHQGISWTFHPRIDWNSRPVAQEQGMLLMSLPQGRKDEVRVGTTHFISPPSCFAACSWAVDQVLCTAGQTGEEEWEERKSSLHVQEQSSASQKSLGRLHGGGGPQPGTWEDGQDLSVQGREERR